MGEGDKQIRISIVVDQQSTTNAKRLIEDINSSLRDLIENAQRAAQAMGGIGGVKVSGSNNSNTGTGSVSHQANTAARSQGGGGILSGITAGLGDLKGSAKIAGDAFRSITEGVKTFTAQTENVNKFTESIKQLNFQFDQLKANTSGGGSFGGGHNLGPIGSPSGSGGAGMIVSGGGGGAMVRQGGNGGNGGIAIPGGEYLPPGWQGPGGRGSGGGGGAWSGDPGLAGGGPSPGGGNSWKVGGALFDNQSNGFTRGIGRVMGMPGLSEGGGPAMAIQAGLKIAAMVTDAMNGNEVSALENETQKPFWEGRKRAAWGVFAHQAQAERKGDISTMVAERLSSGRLIESMKKTTSSEYRAQQEGLVEHQLGFYGRTASLGDLGSTVWGGIGAGVEEVRNGVTQWAGLDDGSAVGGIKESKKDLQKNKAMQQLEERTPGLIVEQQQLAKNDPRNIRTIDSIQDIYSNAQSVQAMAVSGFSGGLGGVDKKTGVMRLQQTKAGLLKNGLSEAEYYGTRNQVGNNLGPEYLGTSDRLMRWTNSGYNGGMGIAQAGANVGLNASGVNSLFGTIQNTMGVGGIQIGAATQFAGAFAQQMGSQSVSEMPTGSYNEAYSSFAGGINALGGDRNAVSMYESGQRALDARNNGSVDQLQQGLNMSSAVKAFGANWLGAKVVDKLTQAERIGILRSGVLPPDLIAAGVTLSSLKVYINDQNSMALVRFANTEGVKDTAAGKAVAAYQDAGGDIVKYLGKSTGAARMKKQRDLGIALGASMDIGTRAGIGAVQRMAEEAGIRSDVSGKGAFRHSAGGSTQAALNEQGDTEHDEGGFRGGNEKKGLNKGLMKGVAKDANRKESMGQAGADLGMEGVAAASAQFVASLHDATKAIRAAFGGARKRH